MAIAITGCSRGLPTVQPPSIDVATAAQGAIAEFDSDGDGAISREEACSGMSKAWDRYDTDADGNSSDAELQARFTEWSTGDTGMMNLGIVVNHKGQPLQDARIELTPYEFLGDGVLHAKGKTDRYGNAYMAVPQELLTGSLKDSFGVQVGLYRVSITHPEAKLKSKYNTETELSVDLTPAESNSGLTFNLK